MSAAEFELIEAQWPEKMPAAKKAIRDFLSSTLNVAEIKGDRDFLINVRRTAKSNGEFRDKVEMQMVDGRMYIRRKHSAADA